MGNEVHRILRVDHAGEAGAIQIYRSQLAISRYIYPDIVDELEDMLEHENEHFKVFDRLLKERGIRRCYALSLWALGGWLLGLLTALLGRNSIWVCTNAIETTVLKHLEHQLSYLGKVDNEAYEAVLSIRDDECMHQKLGRNNQTNGAMVKPVYTLVCYSTSFAIWLSSKL